jgi:hypothetical protein
LKLINKANKKKKRKDKKLPKGSFFLILYSSDSVSLSPLRLVASLKGQRAEGPLKLLPPFKKVARIFHVVAKINVGWH